MEQKDVKEEKSKKISRRNFIKATGVAGLAIGTATTCSLSNPGKAFAGEDTGRPIVDFAVKKVEKPSYMYYPFEGAEKLERFKGTLNAQDSVNFRNERLNGNDWRYDMFGNSVPQMASNMPGYSLLDYAFDDAGWTSDRTVATTLYSWERIAPSPLRSDLVGKWEGTPEENNKIIKKAANFYGAGEIGITEVNEQWFYSESEFGVPIIFSDEHDKPLKTEEAQYIPKSMKTLVVLAVPISQENIKYVSTPLSQVGVSQAYSTMAETASKVAEFIRGIGYNAIPMGNDTGLSIPMAIDAGLGELGRHGLLINPLYGSWFRICKVLTDLPSTYDKPIEFGAAKFCRTCMKCAEKCPSSAISTDKDPSTKVYCESNNPGMKKWYVKVWDCLEYWAVNGASCSNCIAVCPYTKPQTWIHDIVKGVSGTTTVFNGMFRKMDDILSYGSTVEENDPSGWWTK